MLDIFISSGEIVGVNKEDKVQVYFARSYYAAMNNEDPDISLHWLSKIFKDPRAGLNIYPQREWEKLPPILEHKNKIGYRLSESPGEETRKIIEKRLEEFELLDDITQFYTARSGELQRRGMLKTKEINLGSKPACVVYVKDVDEFAKIDYAEIWL
jgi:hypothetical protein